MTDGATTAYASRAGEKLAFALQHFGIDVTGLTCADFGSNTGGFVDCLLQSGAAKVYAVETGYGVLAWKLRNDPRVVVMERTNAMHVTLPEQVDLLTTDTSWTKLEKVLPNVLANLAPGGSIIALVKPHYEAPQLVRGGKLPEERLPEVLESVRTALAARNVYILGEARSPLTGEKKGNAEYLFWLAPTPEAGG